MLGLVVSWMDSEKERIKSDKYRTGYSRRKRQKNVVYRKEEINE
jgi:hypothetical protein